MPGAQDDLLCRCRGLTLGMVRRALAAGARSLGEVRALCAGEALPPGPPGRTSAEVQGGCCTARLSALIRAGVGAPLQD